MKRNHFLIFIFSITIFTNHAFANIAKKEISVVVEDKNPLRVLTPSLKNVKTKKLVLHNGIRVFLISDPEARQSAAALAVNVGQWHDDKKYPGIAHFCEHMLFMGSEKYPDENYYTKFITDNGGSSNAYTAPDRTVYMFKIDNEKIIESIDIFSRFFIDPRFSESAISRELLAVNQEYQKNIEHDGWREWRIFKEEGNKNHPNKQFSIGNENTLKVIGRENLIKWYKKHYKPSGMYLVVSSSIDIDTLSNTVEKSFSQVKATTESAPSISYTKVSSPSQEGHMTFIEPVKDIRSLKIRWEVPPAYANDMEKKTYNLIAYSLTHHLKGGLYAQLKEEGLINNLTSDCDRVSSNHLLLEIEFDLTAEGMQKRDHILYTFYSTLNKLKKGNIPQHIYQDMQSVLSTSYQWQSRKDPFSVVKDLAHKMVDENLDTFPYKTVMISDFDPKSSRDLLSFLTPYNAMIVVIGSSKETHRTATKQEKWLGGKYCVSKIPGDVLQSWENAPPHETFTLPHPNPYLSKHQKLLVEEAQKEIAAPTLIANEEAGMCYFLQDTHYLIPKTQIMLRIKSPDINATTNSICLNELYSSYLNHHLASLTAEGAFAGIHTSIYPNELGLNITVDGYHDKIGSYMMSFLSTLTTTFPTKEEFLQVKEQLLIDYADQRKAPPYHQALLLTSSLLSNARPNADKKKLSLENLTFDDFKNFHKNILQSNYLKVYISGNIDKDSALLHFSEIKNTLAGKESTGQFQLIPEYTPFYSEVISPKMVKVQTKMQGNAAILAIDNGAFSYKNFAIFEMLTPAIKEAFYTELRSKQQTGYITASITRSVEGQLLRYFLVQSTTHYAEELLARYELFLENFSKNIATHISEERFDNIKASIITKLQKPIGNLSQHAATNFELAYTYNADFERNKKKIDALEKLDYETFIKNSQKSLCRQNRKRLAILIEGEQADNQSFSYTTITPEELLSMRKD